MSTVHRLFSMADGTWPAMASSFCGRVYETRAVDRDWGDRPVTCGSCKRNMGNASAGVIPEPETWYGWPVRDGRVVTGGLRRGITSGERRHAKAPDWRP